MSEDDLEALQRAFTANAEQSSPSAEMETDLAASLVPALPQDPGQIPAAVAPFMNTAAEDDDAFSLLEGSSDDEQDDDDDEM